MERVSKVKVINFELDGERLRLVLDLLIIEENCSQTSTLEKFDGLDKLGNERWVDFEPSAHSSGPHYLEDLPARIAGAVIREHGGTSFPMQKRRRWGFEVSGEQACSTSSGYRRDNSQ